MSAFASPLPVFTPVPASGWTPSGSPGSLQYLCSITKRACDILTPMIVSFYNAMNSNTSKLKADKSVFTIADGTVQHLLVEHLFAGAAAGAPLFRGIVGEESCTVNLLARPYTVDGLEVPAEFHSEVERTMAAIKELSGLFQVKSGAGAGGMYQDLTVFIDPIDGTREFSTAKGEQSTVCIGFANAAGASVAGVVYRPITNPPTWAAGAKSENYVAGDLLQAPAPAADADAGATTSKASGLLTSNGAISPFIEQAMLALNYPRVPSGGAGNKVLLLLEGRGSAYIQDRGVSRWDTCAAQACIEARGGSLTKLTAFLSSSSSAGTSAGAPTSEHYTYLQSRAGENLDFIPGVAALTAYNCSPSSGFVKGPAQPPRMAVLNSEVGIYCNLCGIVALSAQHNSEHAREAVRAALLSAAAVAAPEYD